MCPCAIAVRRRQSLLRATGDSTPGYAGPPLRGGEPPAPLRGDAVRALRRERVRRGDSAGDRGRRRLRSRGRSEEHTSELQSRLHLVCRLLLEKKKQISNTKQCIRAQTRTT